VAAFPLVIGGLIALRFRIQKRTLGLVMAFGVGLLISAVAYQLTEEAAKTSAGGGGVGLGFFSGAVVFFLGDFLIDRKGGQHRKRSEGSQATGSGLAIVLGTVLDGIPESLVIGVSLLAGAGASLPLVVAVFLSNIAEAVPATTGLVLGGWKPARVLAMWGGITIVSGLSSLAGYALFGNASPAVIAYVLAFAGGAILVMLADTMMPEAFELGGKLVGLATAIGFALAFALTQVG
jgi:zinc transporter, ZIP family